MRRGKEDIRAEMMAAVGELVDEWLAWQGVKDKPTLTEMEEVVLRLRERVGRQMLELMVREQEAVKPEAGLRCEQCGVVMGYKGQKKRGVGTRVGALAVERAYYYCPRCEAGFFPSGPAVGDGGRVLE